MGFVFVDPVIDNSKRETARQKENSINTDI